MAKSKDFDEFYGKVIFDDDPGKKKLKFSRFGDDTKAKLSQPLEVIVVDKNQNILTDKGGKTNSQFHKHFKDKSRDKSKDIHKDNARKKEHGGKSSDAENMAPNDDGNLTYDFGHVSDRDVTSRSGVQLTFAGDASTLREVGRSATPVERYESDEELVDFCVDHMHMCRSRKARRRARIMDILSDSPSSSAYTSTTGSSAMSSLRGSGHSSRSSHELHVAPMFYVETLERLYEYAGTIVEDRQALKDHLTARRQAVLEQYYDFMEDVITHILKLKQAFLETIEETHKVHARAVSKQTTKYHRVRHETRLALQCLQEATEAPNPDPKKLDDTFTMATQRAGVFGELLQRFYDTTEHYRYTFVPSDQLNNAFKVERVAYVDVTVDTPILPPFLSTGSGNKTNDDGSSGSDKTEFVNCSEGELLSPKRCAFSGVTFITKDSLLVADWSNGFVKLFNRNGVLADRFEFEESPWDVVCTSDGQAAVTVPKLKAVYFLESDPHLKVTRYFSTDCECFGIDKTGDNYVITCDPWSNLPSVRIFSEMGRLLRLFQLSPSGESIFKCPLHVCVDYFNTVIFVSDSSADCVHLISLKGNVMSRCEHGLLEYPTGLTVDRNNLVYVCSKSRSNIHVLNGQGVHQRIDLRARDGLHSPRALCFHPYGDVMVITDLEGSNSNGFLKKYIS